MQMQNDTTDAIEREAQRIEEDCTYSSKGYYNAAEGWSKVHLYIGIPTAILAAIGSGTAFSEWGIVAGAIGILTTALVAVATFLDPSQKNSSHRVAGDQYLALRNATRRFREIELPNLLLDDAQTWIYDLAKRRDDLNAGSPQIPRRAFERARKGIEEGESRHAVD